MKGFDSKHSAVSSVKIIVLTKSDYVGNEPAAHVRCLAITLFELAILKEVAPITFNCTKWSTLRRFKSWFSLLKKKGKWKKHLSQGKKRLSTEWLTVLKPFNEGWCRACS